MFYVLFLKKNTIGNSQKDKNITEFNFNGGKKYKVRKIWNNIIYFKKLKAKYLSKLDYLISWKSYPKKEYLTAYINC